MAAQGGVCSPDGGRAGPRVRLGHLCRACRSSVRETQASTLPAAPGLRFGLCLARERCDARTDLLEIILGYLAGGSCAVDRIGFRYSLGGAATVARLASRSRHSAPPVPDSSHQRAVAARRGLLTLDTRSPGWLRLSAFCLLPSLSAYLATVLYWVVGENAGFEAKTTSVLNRAKFSQGECRPSYGGVD